jgi:hypothetical protein
LIDVYRFAVVYIYLCSYIGFFSLGTKHLSNAVLKGSLIQGQNKEKKTKNEE